MRFNVASWVSILPELWGFSFNCVMYNWKEVPLSSAGCLSPCFCFVCVPLLACFLFSFFFFWVVDVASWTFLFAFWYNFVVMLSFLINACYRLKKKKHQLKFCFSMQILLESFGSKLQRHLPWWWSAVEFMSCKEEKWPISRNYWCMIVLLILLLHEAESNFSRDRLKLRSVNEIFGYKWGKYKTWWMVLAGDSCSLPSLLPIMLG